VLALGTKRLELSTQEELLSSYQYRISLYIYTENNIVIWHQLAFGAQKLRAAKVVPPL